MLYTGAVKHFRERDARELFWHLALWTTSNMLRGPIYLDIQVTESYNTHKNKQAQDEGMDEDRVRLWGRRNVRKLAAQFRAKNTLQP